MDKPRRNIIAQPQRWTGLLVGTVPTPLSQAQSQVGLSAMYDSIICSLVSTATNSVFWGDSSVTGGANGLEIRPGIPIQMSIVNDRQLYEIQGPLVTQFCLQPEGMPFIVWDPSTIYLISPGGAQTMAVGFFQAAWI